MAHNTEMIRHALDCLDVVESGEATADQVAALLERMGALSEYVKALKSRGNDAVMEWIRHNGDLTIGPIRYYVGTSRKTAVRDNAECMDRLLDVFGGDVQAVAEECLSSNAWKTSQVRHHLGDGSSVLQTIVTEDLKTGKPKRELKKLNTTFSKRIPAGKRATDGHAAGKDGAV